MFKREPEPEPPLIIEETVRENRMEVVGYIHVQSGQVMIGDPSFLPAWKANGYESKPSFPKKGLLLGDFIPPKPKPTQEYSFDGACTAAYSDRACGSLSVVDGEKTQVPLAVVSRSDQGMHAVFAERDLYGRIVALHVKFDNLFIEGEAIDNNPEVKAEDVEDPNDLDWLSE